MKTRNHLCRIIGLVLALAVFLTTAQTFTAKTSAAETKTTTEYFAYRVDVMDASKGNSDCVAVQVMSSIDGAVYIYVKYAGEDKPSVKDIMGSGYKTLVTANEETEAYGHIYWMNKIEVGKKYDVYMVFEDPVHNTYGPFTVKKWTAKYFPAGSGTKKKPYQIWTARHLFNMSEYTGEEYKGKYFKVMQDIDLSESIYSGRVCDYASTFYGIFDGNGKTIRGLIGNLFDNLESTAIVRNVYVAGADTTRGASGGIAGVICENNKGIIEKCVVYNSELSCDSYQGIIAGINREYGIVRNCASVDCKIYAYDTAGGIVGRNEGKIENCYSNITIQGNYSAGGIVGINFGGTVSGCLGTVTTLPKKGDTPNTAQNIGGIVGVQAGSDAFIENCTSMYLPEDLYDLGDVGSVWGGYNTGGDNYLDNITDCVGAVKYTLDDIQLTEKEINGSTNETYLLEKLQKKRESFASHHGASAETRKAENPVKKMIAGGNPDGRNKAVISKLNIKYNHIFENETAAYNKKFKMTEKELTVKVFSAPGKVKIKKVKADSVKEQVTFTWDPVKKAEGYEVYVAKWRYAETGNKYGEYELEETIKSPNATEYTDKYMYKNTQYFYKIRAYWTVNGVKVYGPFSDVQAVKLAEE